jgi:hypothetical protein
VDDERHARRSEYRALSDTRGVMREAADRLADLHDATRRWGAALVAAGLPEAAWSSEQANLQVLSESLPAVSVRAFMTRLDNFAVHRGLAWLHGDRYDLESLREEVTAFVGVVRPLHEAVQRLHKSTVGNRTPQSVPRIWSHPGVLPPLDDIAEILEDLAALAPFMRPLATQEWHSALGTAPAVVEMPFTESPSGVPLLPLPSQGKGDGGLGQPAPPGWTQPPADHVGSSWSDAPRPDADGATRRLASTVFIVSGRLRRILSALSSLVRRSRSDLRLAVVGGVIVVLVLSALLVSRLSGALTATPGAGTTTTSTSHGTGATPTMSTRTPTAASTVTPAITPSPQSTAMTSPKLALTCVVHGVTATLTIQNLTASAVTWKVQPPPTLAVSPAQGTLGAGQSTSAQVTPHHKKPPTGTITVVATQGSASASFSVSCR